MNTELHDERRHDELCPRCGRYAARCEYAQWRARVRHDADIGEPLKPQDARAPDCGDDHDRYMWGGPVLPWMFDDKVELHDAHVRAWEAHRAAKSAR